MGAFLFLEDRAGGRTLSVRLIRRERIKTAAGLARSAQRARRARLRKSRAYPSLSARNENAPVGGVFISGKAGSVDEPSRVRLIRRERISTAAGCAEDLSFIEIVLPRLEAKASRSSASTRNSHAKADCDVRIGRGQTRRYSAVQISVAARRQPSHSEESAPSTPHAAGAAARISAKLSARRT